MRHPEYFFGKNHVNVLTDPDNLRILKPHLLCAAWELPLAAGDKSVFGKNYLDACKELETEGLLRMRRRNWYLTTAIRYPAQEINIRSTSSRDFSLVENESGRLLEKVEESRAFLQLHPGAVYLHQGDTYLVTRLDLAGLTAYAEPVAADYYTQTKDITDIRILKTLARKRAGTVNVSLGEVEVTSTVLGFRKKRIMTEEVIGEEALDLPAQSFSTVSLWFDIPGGVGEALAAEDLGFAGGLHAAEHAGIALLPLFALCDRNDIGGVSTPFHPETGQPQIFIYDAYPGGIGISEKGYDLVEDLWDATLKAISECPCREGCPGCI
ncbi:MAG: DUF1998 domain-containing protein, partial [Dehalococcoidia bacterium]|nr:DUF1998 domain-containing protein [Dehalococcoidia bacterium]